MSVKFDRLDTITHDCAEIWNITGVCNKHIAEETMKFVGHVLNSDSRSTRSEDSVLDISAPATKLLFEEIEKVLAQRNLQQIPDQHWGQIHRQYESTEMHEHTPYHVGWVYYVRVPEDIGLLVFSQFQGWTNKYEHTHYPEVGQLVLFPGWMIHRVTKNFNTIPRISISGNANYIEESK
jgi:hypothetical protein